MLPKPRKTDSYAMVNLNEDFVSFKKSPESRQPAFHVQADWREQQYINARVNGDLRSDQNPDKSLSSGYAEPAEEERGQYEYQEDGFSRASW